MALYVYYAAQLCLATAEMLVRRNLVCYEPLRAIIRATVTGMIVAGSSISKC